MLRKKVKSSNKKWEVLGSKLVLDNPWYRVRKDRIKLPSGIIIKDYFLSELKDIASVFALTKDENVVFVRQYRHPVKRYLLELPAGTFDPGESPRKVAMRELLDETGYEAKKLIYLGKIVEYPTKDSHAVHLFLAKNLNVTNHLNPEATEDIEVVLIPIADLLSLIRDGQIMVSGTIACIIKSLIHLGRIDL